MYVCMHVYMYVCLCNCVCVCTRGSHECSVEGKACFIGMGRCNRSSHPKEAIYTAVIIRGGSLCLILWER